MRIGSLKAPPPLETTCVRLMKAEPGIVDADDLSAKLHPPAMIILAALSALVNLWSTRSQYTWGGPRGGSWPAGQQQDAGSAHMPGCEAQVDTNTITATRHARAFTQ
jgi:hypothetical protein